MRRSGTREGILFVRRLAGDQAEGRTGVLILHEPGRTDLSVSSTVNIREDPIVGDAIVIAVDVIAFESPDAIRDMPGKIAIGKITIAVGPDDLEPDRLRPVEVGSRGLRRIPGRDLGGGPWGIILEVGHDCSRQQGPGFQDLCGRDRADTPSSAVAASTGDKTHFTGGKPLQQAAKQVDHEQVSQTIVTGQPNGKTF